MKHIHSIRRTGGIIYRGASGCSIRQHLGNSHHNHMKKNRRGGSLEPSCEGTSIVSHNLATNNVRTVSKQYIPLKFKM